MAASENARGMLHAALGLVRGTTGALVKVEILNVRGGGVTVDAPAVHTAPYVAGDRVLVLFQSEDLDSAVVAGRVGRTTDATTLGSVPGIIVTESGDVGVGMASPQARLQVWDGTGGFLFGSRTAISAAAQTIIPDGVGDVTRLVRVDVVVSNGATAIFSAFSLAIGGVTTQNVTIGGDTYQFRLNADGSLDVRRTGGSNAGSVVMRAMWA